MDPLFLTCIFSYGCYGKTKTYYTDDGEQYSSYGKYLSISSNHFHPSSQKSC